MVKSHLFLCVCGVFLSRSRLDEGGFEEPLSHRRQRNKQAEEELHHISEKLSHRLEELDQVCVSVCPSAHVSSGRFIWIYLHNDCFCILLIPLNFLHWWMHNSCRCLNGFWTKVEKQLKVNKAISSPTTVTASWSVAGNTRVRTHILISKYWRFNLSVDVTDENCDQTYAEPRDVGSLLFSQLVVFNKLMLNFTLLKQHFSYLM